MGDRSAKGAVGPEGVSGDGAGQGLEPASRSGIEQRLRAMFEEVASEPVPDRFVELLDQLERSETGAGERDGGA